MEEALQKILLKLDQMDSEIKAMRAEMDSEFKTLRVEMNSELKALRGEMDSEFKTLRGETANEFKALRIEMNSQFERLHSKVDQYHAENIGSDDKLLEGIRTTNDRVDNIVQDIEFQARELGMFRLELNRIKRQA